MMPSDSLLAVDLETTAEDLRRVTPVPVVLSVAGAASVEVVEWGASVLEWVVRALSERQLIFHNAAFDLDVLAAAGVPRSVIASAIRAGRVHDTMLLDALVRNAGAPPAGGPPLRSLAELSASLLGRPLEKGPVRLSFVPGALTAAQRAYAAADARATYDVYQCFGRLPDVGWGPLSESIQVAGALALRAVGLRGLRLDVAAAAAAADAEEAAFSSALSVLEAEGLVRVQRHRKRAPTVHLKEKALRERLARFPVPRTSTGRLSLAREDWDPFVEEDPIVAAFVALKRHEKRLSAFLRRWLRAAAHSVEVEGAPVLHPDYVPFVATGRTSCRDPNLQQVPSRGDSLKGLFCADPGALLTELDYRMLELYAVAAVCRAHFGRSVLADVLTSGRDVHRFLAAQIYRIPESAVDKGQRFIGKMANFGFWGGMGPARFVEHVWRLGRVRLTLEQAAEIRELWRATFPEAVEWLRSVPPIDVTRFGVHAHPALVECILSGRPVPNWLTPSADVEEMVWGALSADPAVFHLDYPGAEALLADARARVPSAALADWVGWRPVVTLTGRIRCPVGYSEFLNTQFQGLAADGTKLALLALWEQGYDIRAYIHDSVVVQHTDPAVPAEVARVLQEEMSKLLRLPVEVEIGPSDEHWRTQ